MGKPAARILDMHVCPQITVLVPHVGGPIMGPGCPTVLIGGLPAAVMGDICTCVGPPDMIALGSAGVMIGGKPAARMGDMTAHGGAIVLGCFTVLIGETGGGGGGASAGGGLPSALLSKVGAGAAAGIANKNSLEDAAAKGDTNAERTNKDDFNAQFTLVDEAEKGIKSVDYEIETSDGQKHKGKTDGSGKTENISGYTAADCRVTFLNK
ncbi:MAG: type secretion protein [Ferruginibacter sp.]|nr:type secretion protein [Ferruginibacter sp.]